MNEYDLNSINENSLLSFNLLEIFFKEKQTPIFLCLGNDKVVADMMGCIVGEQLKYKYNIPALVFGGLNYQINKQNYLAVYKEIKKHNSKIIVIDSCVGNFEDINIVKLKRGGCIPAGAFSNISSVIGDYCILGFTSTIGLNQKQFLRCTSIKNVVKMSNFISSSIDKAFQMATKLAIISK